MFFAPTACETYDRHGPAEGCKNGAGAPYKLDAYRFVSEYESCSHKLQSVHKTDCDVDDSGIVTSKPGQVCKIWCKRTDEEEKEGPPEGNFNELKCPQDNIIPHKQMEGPEPSCFDDLGCFGTPRINDLYRLKEVSLSFCYEHAYASSSYCFGYYAEERICIHNYNLCEKLHAEDIIKQNELKKLDDTETTTNRSFRRLGECTSTSYRFFRRKIPPERPSCQHLRYGMSVLSSVVLEKEKNKVFGIFHGGSNPYAKQFKFSHNSTGKKWIVYFVKLGIILVIKLDLFRIRDKSKRDWVGVLDCPIPSKFRDLVFSDEAKQNFTSAMTLSVVEKNATGYLNPPSYKPFPVCDAVEHEVTTRGPQRKILF
eukprot:UN29155